MECASAIDAHGFSAVSQTSVERASAVVARHVPVATHYIARLIIRNALGPVESELTRCAGLRHKET